MLLRNLPVGQMFRRNSLSARYRYFKTNIKKEEPGAGYYCYNLDGKSEGYFMSGDISVTPLDPSVDCAVEVVKVEDKAIPPEPFWMNYVQGASPPTRRHPDQGTACGEAERLARETRKRVYVMRTTHSVIYRPRLPIPSGIYWNHFREGDC